ncbi:hypothetical protein [Mongoliitalea daihaiensis]|uniref:hypothetical protein n=1 Tax=Mongoliitalea daihaiensis TaxID=2782006 RepID=UPI001F252227|nr:hypothetical protein [Mongoliitalea daihaiensis]UJP65410.1 hypothetical protein IPZ59_01935 [Mongoliitalea daihaiensis]
MKSFKLYWIAILLLIVSSCAESPNPLRQGNAEIVINVATRGVYNFLIRFQGDLYYPTNLPESFQVLSQEPILVSIQFELTGNQKTISRPAPNDIPIPFREIPEVNILSISRRN